MLKSLITYGQSRIKLQIPWKGERISKKFSYGRITEVTSYPHDTAMIAKITYVQPSEVYVHKPVNNENSRKAGSAFQFEIGLTERKLLEL